MRKPPSVRHLALAFAWVVLAAPSAVAEDFSGFYAGVNAGYASDRTDREIGTANSSAPSASDDRGLPPSAANSTLATGRQRAAAPMPARSR